MARNKPNITMEFMVGLPGSGKTTYAKELERKKHGIAKRIDFDATFKLREWGSANVGEKHRIVRNAVENEIRYRIPNTLIMDGLFLTHEDVAETINALKGMFSHIDIVIHQWNEDREMCVKNDGGRREEDSTNTILHAKFEQISPARLTALLQSKNCENVGVATIKNHTIQLKPDWERYFRGRVYVWEDGKMRSQKWCTGGAYGSCWGDKLSPVTPDEQPEFDELDSLLADICPNITFLQYKKLMRGCVEIEESRESDYYGGGCTYNRYVCDIKRLYEILEEFGYTKN